ncbi:MAG: UDPGP type 1 family protein [Lachnospiraceae bacterium]|nr:UDPGP type 1 family protein [Lachnospiraceae bacterium]
MNQYEMMYKTLQEHGQEHVLRFYSQLNQEEKRELEKEIESLEYTMIEEAMRSNPETNQDQIAPIQTLTQQQIKQQEERFRCIGEQVLRQEKVAAVLLAGGQGSRLGFDGPKGTLNVGITKPLYLFEILLRNIEANTKPLGAHMHLYIMTSERNHEQTVAFFKEHQFFGYPQAYIHFFKQDMAPSLDHQGKILLEEKGRISLTPNGNGGWFSSLQRNGMIAEMKENGIEWLNVFSVDNVLQNIGDPVFIGATIANGHAAGAKVIAKVNPDEKVGAICLRNGRPSVVEYSELTDELRNSMDETGNYKYNYGVTLNYLFHIETTEKRANEKMPIHRANKKIECIDAEGNPVHPEEPNGYKLETFIFDILAFFDAVTVFEVIREDEFAPIKNRVGVDSLDSARALLVKKTGIDL